MYVCECTHICVHVLYCTYSHIHMFQLRVPTPTRTSSLMYVCTVSTHTHYLMLSCVVLDTTICIGHSFHTETSSVSINLSSWHPAFFILSCSRNSFFPMYQISIPECSQSDGIPHPLHTPEIDPIPYDSIQDRLMSTLKGTPNLYFL